ncbi:MULTISPECIES: hypothetical protein [Cobetia]|uniref:DUF4148 domain-containing protein n=1 Tax=Cobetia crustatorum TaxID=553385 RepID=A0A558HWU2_9GAMM|nr:MULTISPECIES: hypothetical protein [Cobetia]TVU73568.1 hypothetical protein FQP86_00335 [Cobetia crustatorum]
MKLINTLIATAALSIATTGIAAADSVADAQVRSTLSEQTINGQVQVAATQQATFADTGMSVAAGRVEQLLSTDMIKGERRQRVSDVQSFTNDAGKSVSATRVQHALETSV